MNKRAFDKMKISAESFSYSSFKYIEYDNAADYTLHINNDEIILLLGYNKEAKSYEYIWAANDIHVLIDSLKCKMPFFLSFIPGEWVVELQKAGLSIRNAWHDYFLNGLENINAENNCKTDYLALSEVKEASAVTFECKGQSRGFTGETPEWFEQWLNKGNDVQDTAVLVERTPTGVICGIVCVGLYGYENESGPVAWIREAAVKPEFQGKGIARKLISQALMYGKKRGAKKAFLAVDEDNTNAIHLYTSMGFAASKDDSEITMIKY